MTSVTWLAAMGSSTSCVFFVLAFTSTQTQEPSSSSRRQKPNTSSPSEKGSQVPFTSTGSALRTPMALR